MAVVTVDPARSGRSTASARRTVRALPWAPILVLSAVMALGDGFWLTSLRGAVGAIERSQGPFLAWLMDAGLVLPIFAIAVAGAFALAMRWFGRDLERPKVVIATLLLVAAAGTLVGIGQLVASSAYDYRLQTNQAKATQYTHHSAEPLPTTRPDTSVCTEVCRLERAETLSVHRRGVTLASGLLLVTNLVLVGWVVAMRGGRIGAAPRTGTRPRVATSRA